jgi:hypothetical protein
MAWQTVVGDRLPRRGVAHELADTRSDAWIAGEGTHADPDRVGVRGITAEQRRAAVTAKPLLASYIGLPHAQSVFASDDPESALRGMRAFADAAAPLRRWQRLHWQ